jgi:nitrogen fixation NifU-like protein
LSKEHLYRQQIIELWRNPTSYGEIPGADIREGGSNPLCGDDLKLYIVLSPHSKGGGYTAKITKASFTGNGCAISRASASLLCGDLSGRTPEQVLEITPSRVQELLGVEISPARLKCALLPLRTAKEACAKYCGRKFDPGELYSNSP